VNVNRRAFLGSVAGLVLAPRLTADPRKTEKLSRIGYLSPAVPTALEASWLLEFRAALNARGHSPEARFVLEERYASDRTGRLPALARELLDTGVDVSRLRPPQASRPRPRAARFLS
jgi:hypothetical protein